jgi:folylpolyglutamate synthase/dihydropteroate synthase
MRGKKVPDVLRALAPLRPRFVFTRVDDPSAHDPAALARQWRRLTGNPAATAPTPREALLRANGDPIIVAGSLYLVGAVRGLVTGTAEEADQ